MTRRLSAQPTLQGRRGVEGTLGTKEKKILPPPAAKPLLVEDERMGDKA